MGRLLNDCEAGYFDSIASEVNSLAGTQINFYNLRPVAGEIDPLYGEHTSRAPVGPIKMWATFEWPQVTPESGEPGFHLEFDCQCYIARVDFDKINAEYPYEGDVIEAWRTPYHIERSKGTGLFFDVIKVENDGHVNDSPTFVQFRLSLKRRTEYNAERRLNET